VSKREIDAGARIYVVLVSLFTVTLVLSNIISVKLVQVHGTWLFPAGILTYPLTFLISDLVNELYGAERSRLMVRIALGMNVFSMLLLQAILILPSGWVEREGSIQFVFGANLYLVMGSLLAFTCAQFLDIFLFQKIRSLTKGRHLWLRNSVSTLFAQLVDTLIVDSMYVGLYLGFGTVSLLRMMGVSYVIKIGATILSTPLLYAAVWLVRSKWSLIGGCSVRAGYQYVDS